MKRAFLPLLYSIALCSFITSDDPREKLIAGFKKYLEEFPQEKIYLHFDRPYYTNGDTIWFKAYLTTGPFHLPSRLSRTVYIELINSQGQLVQKSKLLADDGSVAGNMALPDSLASDNYLVRAHTRWMRNGEEDYFFHRTVKIWNKGFQTPAKPVAEKSMDIRFFPEGGHLVSGIAGRVAFKAVGADGLGKEIKGKVTDESGTVVREFKGNILGMGAFSLTPQKGKTYHAIIENHPDVLLPVKDFGLVLSVRNSSSGDLTLRIQTTDYTKFRPVYVVAQTRGIVCYAAKADMSSNSLSTMIPKSKLPVGVAQITVTDSTGIPLAERLTFVDKEGQMALRVTPDKATYAPRELVNLQIEATYSGKPVVADLSMAVCDDSQVLTDENRETINSYLLLTSDLRGYIESPGYYFNPLNADRTEALDYLLLTQGWRRFTFRKVLEPEWQKPEFNMEQGLTISGKMVDKFSNKPIANGKVSFVPLANPLEMKTAQTNAIGDFELSNIIYFGTARAVVQGERKKGNKWIKFLFDTIDFHSTRFPLRPLTETQTQFEKAFIARSIERKNIDKAFDKNSIMLKEVVVIASKDKPEENSSIYGEGSFSESASKNPASSSMQHPLQLIQGRVAGVQVFGSGLYWTVSIRGGTTPLIMVDDMQVGIEMLNSIPVSNIESYSVWKGPDASIFGMRGGNGVIGFFTKKGAANGWPQEGIFSYKNTGFQVEREFYVPKYDLEKVEHKKPDERITLFWAPHIQTDSLGHASISFYNHDLETSVTGVVEGISIAGKPGTSGFKYSIKKK